ncbi:hypothetical protein [Brazilian marseillevirus]|uniref:hypothetical protein n=1 Tax=Brazilian marseillevirus TaxID=1813599 RepID=UPI0007848D60|nr:hypothetical protein A3303_gp202 [Brazilian marseillevirus]AMQ10710.1 hypothetical protein [Brazilian marseillevirus]
MESWERKKKIFTKFTIYLENVSFSGKVHIKDLKEAKKNILKFLDGQTTDVPISKNFFVSACISRGVCIDAKDCSIHIQREFNHFNVKKVAEFLECLLKKVEEELKE